MKQRVAIPYNPRIAFMPFHDRTQRWACLIAHRRAGKTVAAVNDIIRAASVLQVGQMCVRSSADGSRIELAAVDKGDVTSNYYSLDVGENESGATFEFIFDVDNLKILQGDYRVSISQKIVSCFTNKNEPLTYWIALNGDSSYEA